GSRHTGGTAHGFRGGRPGGVVLPPGRLTDSEQNEGSPRTARAAFECSWKPGSDAEVAGIGLHGTPLELLLSLELLLELLLLELLLSVATLGVAILSVATLSVATLGVATLSVATLGVTALRVATLSVAALRVATLGVATLGVTALSGSAPGEGRGCREDR